MSTTTKDVVADKPPSTLSSSSKPSALNSRNQSINKQSKTNKINSKQSLHSKSRDKPRIHPSSQHLMAKIKKFRIHTLTKYNPKQYTYNSKVINDIIHDERKHIVAVFKNLLFWDETSDFLKRFYFLFESINRLPQIASYYETYTLFAPVYFAFEDVIKIMNKNTKRKRRYLELIEENEDRMYNEIQNGRNNNKEKNVKYIISQDEIKEISSLVSVKNNNTVNRSAGGNDNEERSSKSFYSNYVNEFHMLMNYNFKHNIHNNSESGLITLVNDDNFHKEHKTLFDISNDAVNCVNININNNKTSTNYKVNTNTTNTPSVLTVSKGNSSNKTTKAIEIKKLDLKNINFMNQKTNTKHNQNSKTSNNTLKYYIIPTIKSHTQRDNKNLTSLVKISCHNHNSNNNSQPKKTSLTKNKQHQLKFQTIESLLQKIQKQQSYNTNHNSCNCSSYNNNNNNSSNNNNKTYKKLKYPNKKENNIHSSSNSNSNTTSTKIKNNLVIQTKHFTKKTNNNTSNTRDTSLHNSNKHNHSTIKKINSSNNSSSNVSASKTKYPNKISITSPSSIINNNVIIPSSIYNINLNLNLEHHSSSGSNSMMHNNNNTFSNNKRTSSITTSLNKKKPNNLLHCVKKINTPTTNNALLLQTNCVNKHNIGLGFTSSKLSQHSMKSLKASKLQDNKISYDLNVNNVHISIHKQTGSNSHNQGNSSNNTNTNNNNNSNHTLSQNHNSSKQHSVNININCGATSLPVEKKMSRNDNMSSNTQSSGNKTGNKSKQGNQNNTLSMHTNKGRHMVIPVVSGCDTKKNKQFNNNKDDSVSLLNIRKRLIKDNKHEQKYPLTSRNEKESIPYGLINKIIQKSK